MKKGFTLIELLVVIAIIGILAAIVLVSLSGARDRAKDARITGDMNQIRSTAEIKFSEDGDYSDVGCDGTIADSAGCSSCTNSDIQSLCEDMFDQGATSVIIQDDGTDGSGYCAEAQLNSGDYWCVDGNMVSKNYGTTDPDCDATSGSEVYTCE